MGRKCQSNALDTRPPLDEPPESPYRMRAAPSCHRQWFVYRRMTRLLVSVQRKGRWVQPAAVHAARFKQEETPLQFPALCGWMVLLGMLARRLHALSVWRSVSLLGNAC